MPDSVSVMLHRNTDYAEIPLEELPVARTLIRKRKHEAYSAMSRINKILDANWDTNLFGGWGFGFS